MSGKVTHVIVNPIAGGGRFGNAVPALRRLLVTSFGEDVAVHITRFPRHASQLARESILDGAELVVAVGGDGTVQEVVNGFFERRQPINPDCELGVINFGTGQGVARTLRLPQPLEEQITVLLDPGYVQFDVGCVGFRNAEGGQQERLFLNECQVGIGAAVVAAVGKTHKRFGGRLAFGAATLGSAFSFEAIELKTTIDAVPVGAGRFLGLVVANGNSTAGGMRITPEARPDDGLFDILFIHDMSLLQRLVNFPRIYSGTHLRSPFFTLRQGRSLSIGAPPGAGLEADGETLGTGPCRLLLLPGALRVKSKLPPSERDHEQLAPERSKVRV